MLCQSDPCFPSMCCGSESHQLHWGRWECSLYLLQTTSLSLPLHVKTLLTSFSMDDHDDSIVAVNCRNVRIQWMNHDRETTSKHVMLGYLCLSDLFEVRFLFHCVVDAQCQRNVETWHIDSCFLICCTFLINESRVTSIMQACPPPLPSFLSQGCFTNFLLSSSVSNPATILSCNPQM